MSIVIRIANSEDLIFASTISKWYQKSSENRGTGIAVRSPEYLLVRINNGNSIVALDKEEIVGFCYLEVFQNKEYVSNSGLIIKEEYRGQGLSKKIKKTAFDLARNKFHQSKIFGITTSEIVMKINSDLGYRPVPLHKLTTDDTFWKGCSSCKNYDILLRNDKKLCLCTGMICTPKNPINLEKPNNDQK
jgi:hypothetical protein